MLLASENKIILHKEAGSLIHSFGEGYHIVDENGNEVNSFSEGDEFMRLIEKFKHRQFLMDRLNKLGYGAISFGENNVLLLNGKDVFSCYWKLPEDDKEEDLCYNLIEEKLLLEAEKLNKEFDLDRSNNFGDLP